MHQSCNQKYYIGVFWEGYDLFRSHHIILARAYSLSLVILMKPDYFLFFLEF